MSLAKVKNATPSTSAPAEEVEGSPAVAASNPDRLPYRALYKKHSAFSRKLRIYTSSQEEITTKFESEDGKVVLSQKLLRNFVFTHNWVHLGREDDRYTIPTVSKPTLEKILGKDLYDKFQEALRAKKDQIDEILPKQVEASKLNGVAKFVKDNEKVMVIEVLEKAVNQMKDELQERKGEKNQKPKPKSSSAKKDKGSPKNAKDKKKSDLTAEEKFKDMIGDVRSRLRTIKFAKDGHKQYSEVQSQLDSLLFEATDEIQKMKKNLK